MLDRNLQGHMGIEKSKRRAINVSYWPGMNSQISGKIARCTICLEHQRQNTKEPMIPFCIPSKLLRNGSYKPVHNWDKCEYLVIVDYYSRFFEMASLPNTRRCNNKH